MSTKFNMLQLAQRHAPKGDAMASLRKNDVQTKGYGVMAEGHGAISFILP
ncbi:MULTISPECIES: hypothetical protein [Sphingobium]|jgi:hypothetical protein|nr:MULTISPECIES: hypothetical protein [Sphingobium]MBJ7375541.1 hypothetical protein [Sphingobium sp.]